jgi:hypothetical protein
MLTDANLADYAGMGGNQNSRHALLRSFGADRTVTMTNPREIRIQRRGGTSQGLDILLSELNTTAGREYRFEFTVRVERGAQNPSDGPHNVTVSAVTGTEGRGEVFNVLTNRSLATGVRGTLSFTRTHAQIQTNRTAGVSRYRLGGADAQDLHITGLTIVEITVS